MIKKVKNTIAWTCMIDDINGEEGIGTFYEKKELKKKPSQKEFMIEKLIDRKGEKLYLKCKI